MGKSAHSELCAPTAPQGTAVQAYACCIPCRCNRECSQPEQVLTWVGGYYGKKKAGKLKTQLFCTDSQNLCSLNLGCSINFSLTFHSCKNYRLPCVYSSDFPETIHMRKIPFSCSWGTNTIRTTLSITRVERSQQGSTSKDRFFPE